MQRHNNKDPLPQEPVKRPFALLIYNFGGPYKSVRCWPGVFASLTEQRLSHGNLSDPTGTYPIPREPSLSNGNLAVPTARYLCCNRSSLYNFGADCIGSTAPFNFSIVLCVFVSTETFRLIRNRRKLLGFLSRPF
jgi:hypothetical protein